MISDSSRLPKKFLVFISLLQGLALLLLHEAIEFEFWPYDQPKWLFCFYALATVGPLMVLLSLEKDNWKTIVKWALPFTAICGLLGFYQGFQVILERDSTIATVLLWGVPTVALASFKALMYIQQKATGEPFSYHQLFLFSWRNFLTLGLSLLFTLAVWGILMLWGGLFKILEIDFFFDLFTEEWFFYPALSLANGFGIIIFRSQSNIIDVVTRIQQALMKFLLVFVVMVSILFLVALPFTGLSPLWETGSGSLLILWMQALILFFLNAVYQDDPDTIPYPVAVHRFIYAGVVLLPIYSAIVFYGLSLRVNEYGWTVGRCWGFLIWGFFALFSVGYAWGIIRRKDAWLHHLSWINVRMGLGLLGLMLLINSPLLDFRKISAASQIARFERGDVSWDEFDVRYFSNDLARPGYKALQQLKMDTAETNPEIGEEIDRLYALGVIDSGPIDKEKFLESIKVTPEQDIDSDLADALYDYTIFDNWRSEFVGGHYLFQADLDEDGESDYVLVALNRNYLNLTLFSYEDGRWNNYPMAYKDYKDADIVAKSVKSGDVEVIEPRWKFFKVGEAVYWVTE